MQLCFNIINEKSRLTALTSVPVLVLLLLALNVFAAICFLPTDSLAKARLSTDARITDCKACHGGQAVLPSGHKPVDNQSLSDCKKCHGKEAKGLRTRVPLSHLHMLSGVSCQDCHKNPQKAEPLDTSQCLACHDSPEKLAQVTAKMEYNPHTSPHYGTTLDCNLCHHLHQKSENYCAQCHDWKLSVP